MSRNFVQRTEKVAGRSVHQLKIFISRLSVAKWLDYSPFTSKVAGSNPSSVLGPSPHVKRAQVNALRKVVGFLRVLQFPPTEKVDRVG